MKHFIKFVSIIGLFTISQLVYPAPITDTYKTGDTLTATILNNFKSAVNSNDARITSLNLADDFSGYFTPFSAIGAAKNVIVTKTINFDGSGTYRADIFYENSIEQISIDGVMITPKFIAKYVEVNFGTNGALTGALFVTIESPKTIAYRDVVAENTTFDIISGAKSPVDDDTSYIDTCIGSGALEACVTVTKLKGVQTSIRQVHVIRTLLGSGSIGSMAFSDLLSRQKHSGTRLDYRVHAKGIGRILRFQSDNAAQRVIYFDVDGATGGSLAGTPFDSTAAPFGTIFF